MEDSAEKISLVRSNNTKINIANKIQCILQRALEVDDHFEQSNIAGMDIGNTTKIIERKSAKIDNSKKTLFLELSTFLSVQFCFNWNCKTKKKLSPLFFLPKIHFCLSTHFLISLVSIT